MSPSSNTCAEEREKAWAVGVMQKEFISILRDLQTSQLVIESSWVKALLFLNVLQRPIKAPSTTLLLPILLSL